MFLGWNLNSFWVKNVKIFNEFSLNGEKEKLPKSKSRGSQLNHKIEMYTSILALTQILSFFAHNSLIDISIKLHLCTEFFILLNVF